MKKDIPLLKIPTIQIDIQKEVRPEGTIYLHTAVELEKHPDRITDRLVYWAKKTPKTVFLAQRGLDGQWQTLNYEEVWAKVQSIAQYLLNNDISSERPVVILSGNSLEHGLMALAAMHIGIPYSPLSPAYSLRSTDFRKVRQCIDLLSPGLIFVQNAKEFETALMLIAPSVPVIAVSNPIEGNIRFEELLKVDATQEVMKAYDQVGPDTVAKILFTSGSTGEAKGVINTHGNITANWQQITQTFPFIANGTLTLIDWLPWNHTFGGNHNFGITLYNGGTLYVDEGNPTLEGFSKTLDNLRSIAPTIYFNVPRGYDLLIPHLKADKELSKLFFSRLKMLFFAGASLPQHIWHDLDDLAKKSIGKRLLIASGYGMTETSPSALFNTVFGSLSASLGVPVPGLKVKLVPDGDKFEARFRGKNVSPGYWRNREVTVEAFDEEGFFKSGDALRLVNNDNANAGLVFDGRLTEDFKLSSGTWVNVGLLRERLIEMGNGLIKDAVITGHNRAYLGAIIFPDLHYCAKLAELNDSTKIQEVINADMVLLALQEVLNILGKNSTGSSTLIKRAIFSDFLPLIERGEVTDKGSINQQAVLSNREPFWQRLYAEELLPGIIEFKK
ncbi:MAG: feruloyl-CoA synthase [Maribacter sp.]|nr:feruloyl-CoA synthase [Maribacter sp.]